MTKRFQWCSVEQRVVAEVRCCQQEEGIGVRQVVRWQRWKDMEAENSYEIVAWSRLTVVKEGKRMEVLERRGRV